MIPNSANGSRPSGSVMVTQVSHPPEPERPDQKPDQDEADDRGDAEAREDRDDDSGRAEYHQRVGHHRGDSGTVHMLAMSDSR